MTAYNSEAPVLDTYHAIVSAYCDFLIVAIHTILYERNIYPETSFLKARKYNYPVRQSRHPKVCEWVKDAVAAVEAEMLKCTVAATSLIIHAPPPTSRPLERYVFSTSAFPRISPSETLIPFNHTDPTRSNPAAVEKCFNPPPTSDLPEQFRATFARLSTSLARLKPLPEDCSFTLAIELRDEEGVEPPMGHLQGWIAAEPGLQRVRGEKGKEREEGSRRGKDLGGVRTTPVRSLEAGAFKMEVWVEEGRGKFQADVEEAGGDEMEDKNEV